MQTLLKNVKFEIEMARLTSLGQEWRTEKMPKPYRIVPLNRLYYPLEGEGFASHNGKKYHMRPGYIYLIPAHADVQLSCPNRLVKYWVHFNALLNGSDLDLFVLGKTKYELPVENSESVLSLFKCLTEIYPDAVSHGLEVSSLRQLEAQASLSLLLMPFLELMTDKDNATTEMVKRFGKLLNYIEDNLADNLTLEELARVANLSPTYLSNLFSRYMGIPLIKYCNKRRIQRAVNLLWNTNYAVSKIAYKVGAEDAATFSRLFKRHIGVSPANYKKRCHSLAVSRETPSWLTVE